MNVHTKRGSTSSPRGRSEALAKAEPAQTAAAASPIAPDCSGQDFYAIDAGLQQLLALYLPADTRAHLEPHFKRLGVLAGGRLDELARIADANGPVLHAARPLRARRGLDRVPPQLSRDGGDRLRRLPVPRHEPPRRRARPRRAHAPGRQVRLPVPVRAGRVRHHVPDQRHRHVDLPAAQVREPGAEGLPAAAHAVGRSGRAVEGHAVHDREGRRLRHRPRRDGRPQRGRHLAALRREVVLLARRRRRGPHAGPAGRRARGYARPRACSPCRAGSRTARATATGSCG